MQISLTTENRIAGYVITFSSITAVIANEGYRI